MSARLIIIDDHELLRTGLRLRLEQEPGFQVILDASSVEKALSSNEPGIPDIVILDLDLPGQGGPDAVTSVLKKWPKTQILILTGTELKATAQSLIKLGVNGLVCKNEASCELLRAVYSLLKGKCYLSPEATSAFTDSLKSNVQQAIPKLTERETEVLICVANGLTYKEIASKLSLGVKSIETYRARLTKKLGSGTRAHLVRHAIRLGLVKA